MSKMQIEFQSASMHANQVQPCHEVGLMWDMA